MACNHADRFSLRLRILAWLNIGIQIAFPLTMAFTPVMSGAGSEAHFLSRPQDPISLRTQEYILGEGESTASVAGKYNMDPEALRKLNQFRTFAHGFDNLQPGDALDVPLSPLPEVIWDREQMPSSPDNTDPDEREQKIAGAASQAGSFLSNGASGDAAASMARGMAAGEAGSQLQQWLSRFGTARVQLDADENFSLKNSQLDLLIPLYERENWLTFTQGSVHRTDDRNQANLGFGLRQFNDGWMLGGNTFFDYDLSRDHARMGAGVEYWRDFLKLGANSYLRLTNWKNSPDFEDYEERPANGWDIRAQAWLPALPQLGGKLTFEQYYGNEVALFGRDDRQRDPHAFTAGINYTPIPLLTLGAERRQGKGGSSDTRFGIDMNFQLGVPWRQQFDPNALAIMRSLAGSRYDLVERNNNIVLEYRKKEVIRLYTVEQVTGYAGEQKSLGVTVNSKYGLERIDWSASSLLAAGGKIVQEGTGGYSVVLPSYLSGAQGENTYTISGVAVDRQGNQSNQSETQVIVQAPIVSAEKSTFTPASSELPADGRSTQVLTLTIVDEQSQPLDLATSDITLRDGGVNSATISALAKKDTGIYEVTVTAGTDVETVTLTPEVGGVSLPSASVTITVATPDASQSTFVVSQKVIAADNSATSTLTFTVKDMNGNALTGLADKLQFSVVHSNGTPPSAGEVMVSDITESEAGVYTATLKGAMADTYTVVSEYNDAPVGDLKDTVELTAGDLDSGSSLFSVDPDTITANNTAFSTLTFIAQDINGNAISGIEGNLSFVATGSNGNPPPAGQVTVSSVSESGSVKGTYIATLRGTLADTYTVVPVYNGAAVGNLQDTVELTANATPDGGQSLFTLTPDRIAADNSASSTLTFTARDANGNAIGGVANNLDFGIVGSDGNPPPTGQVTVSNISESGVRGVYTATLTGRRADTYTVTPLFDGTAVGNLQDTVELTAGAPDGAQSTFAADPPTIPADNSITSTLTFTAKDTNGNAISGVANSLSFRIVSSDGNPPPTNQVTLSYISETSVSGTYTATLTGTRADTYTVTPLFGGAAVGNLQLSVELTASDPDGAQSSFAADPPSIPADNTATSTLTFIAKDINGNAVGGQAGNLSFVVTGSNGTTPPEDQFTVSGISEGSESGTYTATLRGLLADTYSIVPAWNGTPVGNLQSDVVLTTVTISPQTINVNGQDYSAAAGFPTTGFNGAHFTIVPATGSASDYTWSSGGASWVSVSEGVVTFTGSGSGQQVTITGTPVSGQGATIEYSFTVSKWYIHDGSVFETWSNASTYCNAQAGYALPTRAQLSSEGSRGVNGMLWNEWGNLAHFTGSGFAGDNYWTADAASSGRHYMVGLDNGFINDADDTGSLRAACVRSL